MTKLEKLINAYDRACIASVSCIDLDNDEGAFAFHQEATAIHRQMVAEFGEDMVHEVLFGEAVA